MKIINRLKFLRIAVCIGFFAGIFGSFELWFPVNRSFPRAPVFFELPENFVVLFERFLTIALVVSLISIICWRRKILFVFVIAVLILLIFLDQTRLQPWVYQYLLLLIILAWQSDDENASDQTLALAQIIITALYFWSGVQKLNFTFSQETLPKLLAPLENLFPAIELPLVFIGIGIALIEAFVGIGLLIRKTRNFAVLCAMAMHTTILILLIAINYNSIVWIWNATLILLVIVAFWKSEISLKETIKPAIGWKEKFAKSLVAASVLLPILSFFGLWDMYLSGALYSGNVEVAVIKIDEDLFKNLPPKARQSVFQTQNTNDKILPLFEWSIADLNVPAYPEKRVSKQIAREVCKLANDQSKVELIVKERPAILDGSYEVKKNNCAKLENY